MIGISLGILLICILLIWAIIGSKGYWWMKATFIIVSCWYCVALFNSLDDFKGWATTKDLPDKFQIHWMIIEPANQQLREKGAIYIVAQDINGKEINSSLIKLYYPDTTKPRLYKVRYTKTDDKIAQNIQDRLMNGEKVVGSRKGQGEGDGQGEGEGGEGGEGGDGDDVQGKGRGGGGDSGNSLQEFDFQELPPPRMPKKN